MGILGGWSLGQRQQAEPLQHDTSPTTLQAAWADFKEIVGEEHISTTETDPKQHSGSAWSSPHSSPSSQPFAIVSPANTTEVSAVMKVCQKRRIPVTAYSDATALEGLFDAITDGVCIDLSRMDKTVPK